MGHAVGADARRSRAAVGCRRARAARAAARDRRTERSSASSATRSRRYWRFLAANERAGVSRRARAGACGPGIDAAPTQSLKSAWFSALRDTAQTSEPTLRWLEARLAAGRKRARAHARRARLHPPGAGACGSRSAGVARRSWTQQPARTQNPDRKARFAFVRRRSSPDANAGTRSSRA